MIFCYACNQWKPGEIAPFAICADCKEGKTQPMTQQPFTEMSLPKRKKYVVIVQEQDEKDPMCCQFIESVRSNWGTITSYHPCNHEPEIYGELDNCDLCGLVMCNEHISAIAQHGRYLCTNCAELGMSQADMKAIDAFTEALNRA